MNSAYLAMGPQLYYLKIKMTVNFDKNCKRQETMVAGGEQTNLEGIGEVVKHKD